MKTPIEELIDLTIYKDNDRYYVGGFREGYDLTQQIEKLLEKEKQMVVDAVNDTYFSTTLADSFGKMVTPIDGEDYFNNKYNKK
jgi:hypothetical protein